MLLYSLLTIAIFWTALKISQKLKSTILNPFLISLMLIFICLIVFNIPYQDYYQGNFPLNHLLGVSIVALALPLYEFLPQIRQKWREILIVAVFGTFVTMLTGVALALLLGANQEILASILPKSVSMPIAIAISSQIGGNISIVSIGVMGAGLSGAILGLSILRWIGVRNFRSIGLSMGMVSHALGTGRCIERSSKIASYSSMALVLCGILSSIIAPFVFKLVVLFCF